MQSHTYGQCRWPGASLSIIRGHKHLHECAYIGDESSEELDEVMEALNDGTYVYRKKVSSESNSLPNHPSNMKRYGPDIHFHNPSHSSDGGNNSIPAHVDSADVTDPKLLKTILEEMKARKEQNKGRRRTKPKQDEDNNQFSSKANTLTNSTDEVNVTLQYTERNDSSSLPTANSNNQSNTQSSSEELYKDVARRFEAIGARHHKVLQKLNTRFKPPYHDDEIVESGTAGNLSANDRLEEITRKKRDILLAALGKSLNENDEMRNSAIEEVSITLHNQFLLVL